MVTTIQVNERTLHLLKRLKEQMKAESYDEVVQKVIAERGKEKSLAGILGKASREDILKDLRDKHDRF